MHDAFELNITLTVLKERTVPIQVISTTGRHKPASSPAADGIIFVLVSYLSIILDILQRGPAYPGEGHCVRAQVGLDRDHLSQVVS